MDLVKLYNQALKYGRYKSKMLTSYKAPEDFAAYCVQRKLEGTLDHFSFALVDYARQDIGNKRNKYYDQRVSFEREKTSYDEKLNTSESKVTFSAETQARIRQFVNGLEFENESDEKAMGLFLQGWTYLEIGRELGISYFLAKRKVEKYLPRQGARHIWSKD